jgi:hypothetical protein
VLIPEVHFQLKGDKGLFKYLHGVLEAKGHCVVCVAEGAGQVRQQPLTHMHGVTAEVKSQFMHVRIVLVWCLSLQGMAIHCVQVLLQHACYTCFLRSACKSALLPHMSSAAAAAGPA